MKRPNFLFDLDSSLFKKSGVTRRIVALILALLIGNPVCCCALGCGTTPAEVASHCCSGGTPVDSGSDQDDGQEREGCDCGFDKSPAENLENKVLPSANSHDLLGGPLGLTEAEVSCRVFLLLFNASANGHPVHYRLFRWASDSPANVLICFDSRDRTPHRVLIESRAMTFHRRF